MPMPASTTGRETTLSGCRSCSSATGSSTSASAASTSTSGVSRSIDMRWSVGSERSLLGRRTADDSGAVIVMFAAAMGAVLVMMALVLDLGAARNDRASDQVAADAMALAGAANLGGSTVTAQSACEAVSSEERRAGKGWVSTFNT